MLLVVASCLPLPAPARAKSKAAQVWSLQQNSDQYGVVTTVVGQDSVRMATAEFCMSLTAPKYDLVMMNTDTKRYMVRPSGQFDALGRKQLIDKNALIQVKKGKTGKVAGLNATQYVFTPKGYRVTLEWWTTDDLHTSPELNKACSKFSGLAGVSSNGFLLRYSHVNTMGRRYVYLDTISVKKVDPATLKFKIPPGYAKVASAMELISPDDAVSVDPSGLGIPTTATKPKTRAP